MGVPNHRMIHGGTAPPASSPSPLWGGGTAQSAVGGEPHTGKPALGLDPRVIPGRREAAISGTQPRRVGGAREICQHHSRGAKSGPSRQARG